MFPLEGVIFHASMIASDSVYGFDALLFIEKSCFLRGVWEENYKNDSPNEGNDAKNDKEPLHGSSQSKRSIAGRNVAILSKD